MRFATSGITSPRENVGTVGAWSAGKARGPHDGLARDVDGNERSHFGGPVFR